jgi:hypothetical protein
VRYKATGRLAHFRWSRAASLWREITTCPMTREQFAELKRQLDQSETMHHKIMAKMTDPRFDLLEAWERKEQLDLEIGRFIRKSLNREV